MKKKLNIDELKIQSFITELKPEHAQTAKGGEAESTIVCLITEIADCLPSEANGVCHSGEVVGEASEVVTENGCMLPTIVICP